MTQTTALPDPYTHAALYQDVPTKRLVAWFVDLLVVAALTIAMIPITFFTAVFYLPFLAMLMSFFYRWVTIARGSATLGMRFTAIELRGPDGGRLDTAQAFLHTLGYHVSIAVFPLQLLSIALMLMSERKQGLTDHVMGTAALNRAASPA